MLYTLHGVWDIHEPIISRYDLPLLQAIARNYLANPNNHGGITRAYITDETDNEVWSSGAGEGLCPTCYRTASTCYIDGNPCAGGTKD